MQALPLWLTLLPFAGIFLILPFSARLSRWIALTTTLAGAALGVYLYFAFDGTQATLPQFVFSVPWIASYEIKWAFAVDGLSFPLVLLTKGMMPIAILASWHESRRVKAFMASFLLLDAAMTGTFLATDIFLFYVFWELMLIPMLLLIGVWGSKDRIYAALKFFLFTFAGSVLMLVAIFWLFSTYHSQFGVYSSNITDFYKLTFGPESVFLGMSAPELIFLGFTIAFLIKVPLFPLHTWLPDAHVQAPTGGSILLAAVLLKMGTYGLLRFSIPIAPLAFAKYSNCLAALAIVGILYGAWVAFQQTDIKKMVAYSSVSHLGFVVLGLCSMNRLGLTGSVLQMVNHGLSTGGLFFIVGMLYERRHTREFNDYGGIAAVVPWLSFFFVFVSASSMAVPGLNGFIGEFLILGGAFQKNRVWAMTAVLGVIFGALYTLSMLKQILFGEVTNVENKTLKDVSKREWAALLPLCAFILWLGVYPKPFLTKIDTTLDAYWGEALKKTSFDSMNTVPKKETDAKRS